MVPLAELWLPVILSAVLVFLVSSILHMVFTYHKSDFSQFPSEAQVQDSLRPLAIPPGDYMIPWAQSMEASKSPEFQQKLVQGPVMIATVLPNGPFNMGKNLGQWFGYSLIVSFFAAYLCSRVLPSGTSYLMVFRVAGTVAFAGYSLALMQSSIWGGKKWRTTFLSMIDGLIYALVTGGSFGMLWPDGSIG